MLHMPQPKICLGMPLYNQTNFLIEALQSLLGQEYRDFRLIIADDSTESKPGQIAKEFASKDNRICYIKNDSRKGMIDNWKACFNYAGDVDYFAWVSDHDVWHPEWLKSLISIMEENIKRSCRSIFQLKVLLTFKEFKPYARMRVILAKWSTDSFAQTPCAGQVSFGEHCFRM
jgi:glycosyltransferase involved in cell wall biosynthesis